MKSPFSRRPLILTAYPLSAHFERGVREAFGADCQTVTVAQLRSQGLIGLLRRLWHMRGEPIVLPIEEENSAALLPVLKLLASCTRSRSICVVQPALNRVAVSRWRIAGDVLRFAGASAACLWAAHRAQQELSKLLRQGRASVNSLPAGGKILYLKTNLWFGVKAGGSIGHIAGVVNGFQGLGHDVTFASAEPPVMIDGGVRFLPVRPPVAYGIPYELNNYRFQKDFEHALESGVSLTSSHLIYQRLSAANYLGALLSKRYRLPLVVEYNGSEVWIAKHWGRRMSFHRLAEMAEEAMLRHAHLVVTVSDALRDELVGRGVEPARIVTYPNCIDPKIFDPARFAPIQTAAALGKLGIPVGSKVVTFVGTFGQWHGAEKLAEAIVRLHREHADWLDSNRAHFLFIGDGLTRPKAIEIIERAFAQSRCTFAGLVPQAETPLYLAASDVLVSPHVPNADGSRFFGSPTKLFEYMAMGKPIIASQLEQIGEVLRPALHINDLPAEPPTASSQEVALLVRPGSVDDLVAGLQFLLAEPAWRQTLGRNASAMALNKYTWDKHVSAILAGLSVKNQ